MSLDVYLLDKNRELNENDFIETEHIFIRENGATKEISREEWDEKFPGREPVTLVGSGDPEEVYSRNITHNLNRMADAAGIYYNLWRPDEIGVKTAKQLIPALTHGLNLLKNDREYFEKFNPENGWGDYDGLVDFVGDYLRACEENPEAMVEVSR